MWCPCSANEIVEGACPFSLHQPGSHPLPQQRAQHSLGRKSLCEAQSQRATPAPAPSSGLPAYCSSRQRMELCQCTCCTKYSLESGRRFMLVASSLSEGCWLLRAVIVSLICLGGSQVSLTRFASVGVWCLSLVTLLRLFIFLLIEGTYLQPLLSPIIGLAFSHACRM